MAFDAGMVCAVACELNKIIGDKNGFGGARVDKVNMPERDEIHLLLHVGRENYRLVVSASSNNPRIHLSNTQKENPNVPPSFCMLLRKHLSTARLTAVRQRDFERVVEIEFDSRDDMGDLSKKFLIAEIMGKYSNIVFCDGGYKILGAIRTNDLSTSSQRPMIVGMRYEMPPSQNKVSPVSLKKEDFIKALSSSDTTALAERALTGTFLGVAPIVAREAVFRASGNSASLLGEIDTDKLWFHFSSFYTALADERVIPTLLYRTETPSEPFEYSFIEIRQYENKAIVKTVDSISTLIDTFFSTKDKAERIKQRSQDIFHLLLKSQNRLLKKIDSQEAELVDAESMEEYRLYGDLISQEMYRIKRGDTFVVATDYSKDGYPEVKVPLDERLSPSQNAQSYYKKYNRKKNARKILADQIDEAKKELLYIDAVLDSLSRAESEADLDELREELSLWGYAKRDKKNLKMADKKKKLKPICTTAPSGREVYIGKNNLQNDYLTTRFAEKNDWWFHVKNSAGSHVILKTDGEEPPSEDFTFAASLAAMHSSVEGENVAVDYTQVRYVKKPPQSKPGFVTYTTHWTAYVTPDYDELKKALSEKKEIKTN